jgi:hypothetical protein
MTMHIPNFRADRLAWRFRKSGADGHHTKQFAAFDVDVQKALARLAEIAENELPAVGCYFDDENWALLTNERLIWSRGGCRTLLKLDEIDDVTVGLQALLHAGTKKELTELTVLTKEGWHHQLQLEAGPPFSGFWNAVKMVAAWNK